MNNFIGNLKSKKNLQCLVITLSDSATLERKRSCLQAEKNFPDIGQYFIQYNSSAFNIFSTYNVKYTPELILLRNDSIVHLSYRDIFSNASSDISPEVQLRVEEFFR
jgi:hypothetical protein